MTRAPRPRSADLSSAALLHTALRGADVDVDGDGELVAPPDATMSAALGSARDVVCDHIATDAAKGYPPFAAGGIAGPPIS